jgi:ubiquinone/menaquinone biosynthesis C-methylase UbiE
MRNGDQQQAIEAFLDILRCPASGAPLDVAGDMLVTRDKSHRYAFSSRRIPLFAEAAMSEEAHIQRLHYNKMAEDYSLNLSYAHTREYLSYLDEHLRVAMNGRPLGTLIELCCGRGEALHAMGSQIGRYIGIDISENMLALAVASNSRGDGLFAQADALNLPLADDSADTVVVLGGVHHVPARLRLFAEIARILKPGGRFVYREPVSDFGLWRLLRALIYRLSPKLDYMTERPLLFDETVPVLEKAGLRSLQYRTHGLIGFLLFMNSDVLYVNRAFRFVPGIRRFARLCMRIDEKLLALPRMHRAGLIVIGVAEKPHQPVLASTPNESAMLRASS